MDACSILAMQGSSWKGMFACYPGFGREARTEVPNNP
jgi:hypothetical protein